MFISVPEVGPGGYVPQLVFVGRADESVGVDEVSKENGNSPGRGIRPHLELDRGV